MSRSRTYSFGTQLSPIQSPPSSRLKPTPREPGHCERERRLTVAKNSRAREIINLAASPTDRGERLQRGLLEIRTSEPLTVFHPSTAALDGPTPDLFEYGTAKLANEELCKRLTERCRHPTIISAPLPRSVTRQKRTPSPKPGPKSLKLCWLRSSGRSRRRGDGRGWRCEVCRIRSVARRRLPTFRPQGRRGLARQTFRLVRAVGHRHRAAPHLN